MKRSIRTTANLVWSLGDTATSALATFLVGVSASVLLAPTKLGWYQLFFLYALLSQGIVYYRHGAPIVRAVAVRSLSQVDLKKHMQLMLRGGAVTACTTAAPVIYCVLQSPADARDAAILGIGAALTIAFLPVRDCMRAIAHVEGRRNIAFMSSVVQLIVVTCGLVYFWFDKEAAVGLLIVFGMASALAAVAGALLILRGATFPAMAAPEHHKLGPWGFAFASVLPQISLLWAYLLLGETKGAEVVGYATAASQFGQGLFLVMTALNFATLGMSTRGGSSGGIEGERIARGARALYATGSLAGCLIIGALLVLPGTRSILSELIPLAYAIPGLALSLLAANLLGRSGVPLVNELIGAGCYGLVGQLERRVAIMAVFLSFSALLVGPFSIALVIGGAGITRRLLLAAYTARIYREGRIPRTIAT